MPLACRSASYGNEGRWIKPSVWHDVGAFVDSEVACWLETPPTDGGAAFWPVYVWSSSAQKAAVKYVLQQQTVHLQPPSSQWLNVLSVSNSSSCCSTVKKNERIHNNRAVYNPLLCFKVLLINHFIYLSFILWSKATNSDMDSIITNQSWNIIILNHRSKILK